MLQPAALSSVTCSLVSTPSAVMSTLSERPSADDGRDDRRHVGVLGQLADEAAVDLDLVEGEMRERGEAGIAGAEIVHGDAHAERLDAVQRLHHVGRMARGTGSPAPRSRAARRAGRSRRAPWRSSCRDPATRNCAGEKFTATVPESSQVAASWQALRSTQSPSGRIRPVSSATARKSRGDRMPSPGPLPAHQRLVAAQPARGELELRLVEDDELVAARAPAADRARARRWRCMRFFISVSKKASALRPFAFALESAVSAARKSTSAFSALTG